MFRRLLPFVALVGLVALPVTARPAEEKKSAVPGIVIRVQSLDELMSNFRYLGGLVGREEEAKQIEGMIQAKAGGPKGFEGVDAKRPMALYGSFGEGGLETSTAVALVPIADEKAFLALLENLNLKAEKDKDGLYEVKSDNAPVPIYFRFAHKYAYVTALNKEAIDKDKLLPPDKVLTPGKTPVFSVTLRLDQIPEKIRDLAISQIEQQLDLAKDEKKDDETPAEHVAKGEMIEAMKKHLLSLLKEGGHLALRVDVDQKTKELSAEVGLTGKEGTPLAKTIAALAQHKSVVAGLVSPDSVMSIVVNLPGDEKMAATMQNLLKEQLQKDLTKESDAPKKAHMEKVFKALAPALKFTDPDMALDLRPASKGLYTLVGGMKVANGPTFEKAIRDVVKELPEKERAPIKLDADKAGEVAVHRIEMTAAEDSFKKSFGDGPVYFGVRSDAVFVAAGEGALEALKDALKSVPKVAAPTTFGISMARIAEAMSKEKPEAPKAAAKAFGKDKGADTIRFAMEAGPELKMRVVVKTPVLTFLHLMEPNADVK